MENWDGKYTFHYDRYKITVKKKEDIEFVQHLLDRIDLWRKTAITYRHAIEMLWKMMDKNERLRNESK